MLRQFLTVIAEIRVSPNGRILRSRCSFSVGYLLLGCLNGFTPAAHATAETVVTDITLGAVLGTVAMRSTLVNFSSSLNEHDSAVLRARQHGLVTQGKSSVTFQGVGFPHIEQGDTPAENRYKPFVPLIVYTNDAADDKTIIPIANVACPGGTAKHLSRKSDPFDPMLLRLGIEHGISASLVKAVITVESCFNRRALSQSGAGGLMQLMPVTADITDVDDVFDAEQNVRGGIQYLNSLRKEFGTIELALAAYNAGPGNVRRYKGIPPFTETKEYVSRVMHAYRSFVATNQFRASRSFATADTAVLK